MITRGTPMTLKTSVSPCAMCCPKLVSSQGAEPPGGAGRCAGRLWSLGENQRIASFNWLLGPSIIQQNCWFGMFCPTTFFLYTVLWMDCFCWEDRHRKPWIFPWCSLIFIIGLYFLAPDVSHPWTHEHRGNINWRDVSWINRILYNLIWYIYKCNRSR